MNTDVNTEATELKIGDKIIISKPSEVEIEFNEIDWTYDMNKYTNKEVTISNIYKNSVHIKEDLGIYYYPIWYCKKVEEKIKLKLKPMFRYIAKDRSGTEHMYMHRPELKDCMWDGFPYKESYYEDLLNDFNWWDSLHYIEDDFTLTKVPNTIKINIENIDIELTKEDAIKLFNSLKSSLKTSIKDII